MHQFEGLMDRISITEIAEPSMVMDEYCIYQVFVPDPSVISCDYTGIQLMQIPKQEKDGESGPLSMDVSF